MRIVLGWCWGELWREFMCWRCYRSDEREFSSNRPKISATGRMLLVTLTVRIQFENIHQIIHR